MILHKVIVFIILANLFLDSSAKSRSDLMKIVRVASSIALVYGAVYSISLFYKFLCENKFCFKNIGSSNLDSTLDHLTSKHFQESFDGFIIPIVSILQFPFILLVT
jgi:hypothetical protein